MTPPMVQRQRPTPDNACRMQTRQRHLSLRWCLLRGLRYLADFAGGRFDADGMRDDLVLLLLRCGRAGMLGCPLLRAALMEGVEGGQCAVADGVACFVGGVVLS